MSLYADEDLGLVNDVQDVDIVRSSALAGPADPVQALTAALALPSESAAQAEALFVAGRRFEEHPEKLPDLCGRLLPMVVDGGETLLRSWTLDMIALAVGRSSLQVDAKSQVAQACLEALVRLLSSESTRTIKSVIPIFSTIHPILFKLLATGRPPQIIHDLFIASKARILSFALDPNARPQNAGVRAAAWKFVQKVLVAGTRGPVADPRLRNQVQGASDPSIAIISRDSLLNAAELEEEAKMLQTQLVTQLYSSSDPTVLHPIIQTFPALCKARPMLTPLLVGSMTSWTPAMMEAAAKPAIHIRAVEKTLKMVMEHLRKVPSVIAFAAQLNDALIRQKQRMELAFVAEQEARKQRREEAKIKQEANKHSMEAESSEQAAKRARMESRAGSGMGKGPEVDVSVYPLEAVVDAVMAGLHGIPPETLKMSFEVARQALAENSPDAIRLLAPALGAKEDDKDGDDEILNPLEMDMDDEDLLLAGDLDEAEDEEPTTFVEFRLPPPEPLDPSERTRLADSALQRIYQYASDLSALPDPKENDGIKLAVSPKDMWMLLVARMASRGPEDRRKALTEYVSADFASRAKFASIWINEEWYNDSLNGTNHYTAIVESLVTPYLKNVDPKDKAFSSFLNALPSIPKGVIASIEGVCEDQSRGIVGFMALRDLLETRPPVRSQALRVLLDLCTHSDRKTRVMAIQTIRRWVPDSSMAPTIIDYAMGVLRRLIPTAKSEGGMDEDLPSVTENRFLGDVNEETVQQHVELAFAITRRQQDLLQNVFDIYAKLEKPIADQFESLLTPLIQSLGATTKLLDTLRSFPLGAEKLALRVVTILSAEGASPVLVSLVKGLMAERELDPGFIIPIIGELDKAEIEKQLPRIVSLLSKPDSRDTVRTAFASILQKLTPADLLVSLHGEEAGRKLAMEAIGLCFSMTSVFRSDVLATALARITELPTLPVVFLRTTIQTVTTYKSLIPFIANSILPKLVAKKIWEQGPLWDGFVKLSKMIAPASFGSLLQLPKEWLKDVLDKEPKLKTGLKGYLAGKGQQRALLEILGEDA
ncbi:Symplekin tight junction protein C terminal-domain-containing protein [Kockovaella imperatae]|uniref:Symplekin tight junction protein C terminal-domain-containing protein n=1 Tax=Kockovaella imperatae TaxID=4999 RepID=A0A1Y1UQC0_9TREE|nr:Symplekin tight junction protein C terminal-domain-containing protein [Kockovaella imperatae]ORX39335.1 Symplekin tight junction protein C terminal-domain-containing protein [Kockovaella imperatae]